MRIGGIWVIHTSAKSGGELVMLFDSYCDDGVRIGGVCVKHTSAKSGG